MRQHPTAKEDLDSVEKRAAISAKRTYDDEDDEGNDRGYAPMLGDYEDSDVMSVDEEDMTADMEELVDLDGSLIHVLSRDTMDNSELLDDIRSSKTYKKMAASNKVRSKKALKDTEQKQAPEVENDPDAPELSLAKLPLMVTDVNDRVAGAFKYDLSHANDKEQVEWDILTIKIKMKRKTLIDGKQKVEQEIKMAAKIFEDGSIAVRQREVKDRGVRRSKRMRLRK
ncbi:hypothetical protein N0V83_010247 [Neocucurbitaria cava]|uniref:Uncharacterized protein n=1 Tax=Neocucurbitaria cava TaxID=798079 RepID=A0A9W8Y0G5_9PLEO|nr:hypothetical protein N0V83_010247 [Neocucurbitaria cava]